MMVRSEAPEIDQSANRKNQGCRLSVGCLVCATGGEREMAECIDDAYIIPRFVFVGI